MPPPKPIVNNKSTYRNAYGRIIRHEEFLDQGVRKGDSPTFSNLRLTGDSYVEGNLYVRGNSTILDSNVIEFEDNIIVLNRLETGNGVLLNQAGLEIARGTLENYRIVFNESDGTLRTGVISNTQAVATRQDEPLLDGVMVWNNQAKRLDATNTVAIDMSFASTAESTSTTTGAVQVSGGASVTKNLHVGSGLYLQGSGNNKKSSLVTDSASNDLVVSSANNIQLAPQEYVRLPFGSKLVFGSTAQSISANGVTSDLNIASDGHVNFEVPEGKRINVPNQVPITFATANEKVFTDSSNNMVMAAAQNILLEPGPNKVVQLQAESPMAFANADQQIYGKITNELYVKAGNHIHLQPGQESDVRVPAGNGIKFGATGNQRIVSNELQELHVTSTSDMYLSPSTSANVVLPANVPLKFGNNASLSSNTSGKLTVSTRDAVAFTNTSNASSASSGSVYTLGGLGVAKSIVSDSDLLLNTSHTNALYVRNGANPVFSVNAGAMSTSPTVLIAGPTSASVQLQTHSDTTPGYAIRRSARELVFTVPGDYGTGTAPALVFSSGEDQLMTADSQSVVSRVAFRVKDSAQSDVLVVDPTDRTTILHSDVRVSQGSTRVHVDTTDGTLTTNTRTLISNTSDAADVSSGALVVSGGVSIARKLRAAGGIDMDNTKILNLANPVQQQDAATKAYVDLVKQGLFVKDAVAAATTVSGTLVTSFQPGTVIDGYTLQQGDRILLKNQANPVENGIYVVQSSGAPVRADDMAPGQAAAGFFVFVQSGTVSKSYGFICNSDPSQSIVGTDALSFTEFTGISPLAAGPGLSRNLNTLEVNVDNATLEIASDVLRIKSSAAGTGLTGGSGSPLAVTSDLSHVTKLGTIDNGTWQASTVQVPYGGTGQTTFTSGTVLLGNGAGSLQTSDKLSFNTTTASLAVGTTNAESTLHLHSTAGTTLLVNATEGFAPQIVLSQGGQSKGAVMLSNDGDDVILHARNSIVTNSTLAFKSTVDATSDTHASVVVDGGLAIAKSVFVGGVTHIQDTTPSTSSQEAALIVQGGLTVNGNYNVANVGNGGGLTVAGGASIGLDLFVGGQINGSGSSSSTFAYLTLTATDEAINLSSGTLVTFGGITIQATTNATSVTNGGSLLVNGGASIAADTYIGGDTYMYGKAKLFSPYNEVLTFHSTGQDESVVFTFDRETTTNDFYISRYVDNSLFESALHIAHDTGIISLYNTTASTGPTAASLVMYGGVSVGGGINVAGDAVFASDLHASGSASFAGRLDMAGNASIQTITATSTEWHYLGTLGEQLSFEVAQDSDDGTLYFVANATPRFTHHHIGNSSIRCIVYLDDNGEHHVFLQCSGTVHLRVHAATNKVQPVDEGNGIVPSGSSSGFDVDTFTVVYDTQARPNNAELGIGSLTAEGPAAKFSDNVPIVGYQRTTNQHASRDLGVLFQRAQVSNDNGIGDVVADEGALQDTLGNQTTVSTLQVRLSSSASAIDDEYIGWWIRVVDGACAGQVRQIQAYNGSQRVAQVSDPWTDQNPASGDIVMLYKNSYVASYFTESDKSFHLGYVSTSNNVLVQHADVGLKVAGINTTSTTANSIATLGGATIEKQLLVGESVTIGDGSENSSGHSLSIRHDSATIALESTSGSTSSITFIEQGRDQQFHVEHAYGNFMLKRDETQVLVVGSHGNVYVNGSLSLKDDTFVSAQTNTGFIGVGSSSGSRVMVHPNEVDIHAGSVSVYTNDTPRLHVSEDGTVQVSSTQISESSSTGSLIVSGGLAVDSTTNAVSSTSGGALTVAGGVAVGKDIWIGGSLFVNGSVTATESTTTDNVTFSNTRGCTVVTQYNNSLLKVSNQGILSFAVEVLPSVAGFNCEVEFDIPQRTAAFAQRSELIGVVSGYTNDNDPVSLFNTLCVGVKNSTRAVLKFQSASTSVHFLSVLCRYTVV